MRSLFSLFEGWIEPFQDRPEPMPRDGVLRFLLYFVRQVRWPFVLMLVLGALTAIIEASLYTFIGDIVDMLNEGAKPDFFAQNGPTLLAMAFVVLVVRALVTLFTALVEEQTVVPSFFNLVRWQSHQAVMDQSLSFFNEDFAGRISQKVWQAGQSAGDFMITLLQTAWYIFVYAIAALILVSELDWRLGAVIALWLAAFGIIARFFIPRIRSKAKTVANANSGVTGRIVDTYTNIQTVKLFGSRREENQGVLAAYRKFLSTLKDFTRTLTAVRATMSFVSGSMIVLISGLALMLWQQGQISVGHVAFALGLVLRLNLLLNRMLGQLNALFRNLGTLQDSMELIVKPVQVVDAKGAGNLTVSGGAIEFDKIRFHYGKEGGLIDSLSLSIESGERVGIVGPSGAGKTTLVSLLLRFYDLESGRILIDGTDISTVSQQSLRHAVGLVTQDTSLLHRSIRENLLYGKPDASEAKMREAAFRAHALEFIEDLFDQRGRRGFDAHVGERGVKLSGGQRQRISIARVLLKDAPILVLDEATSALDSEIENAIQENLQAMMHGKTVIAIAHRLSTIAEMDRLIVIDDGVIVQQGTHADLLLETDGLYHQLWQRQSGGFLPEHKSPSVVQ
ncbi:ATP-binding cassette subfamily B multidrug efflux pump [Roseibium hamelinense]|uniref:ATP-binding cassette subfamily B multidrug efflux pump n=1 Tax=Roseibium hamelinense TaxID=150831 RepID=A0A562SXU5_9HYPH|nr:ATP-binding cassette subfamily B multidrug efflux pump [Roseibium hamelinense]